MDGNNERTEDHLQERLAWAEIPKVNDNDGWYWQGDNLVWDDECDIDRRFRGAGSWAVRRLGGDELAERLVSAVRERCRGADEGKGALLVDGVLFEYAYTANSCEGERLMIVNAELVTPSTNHRPELKAFFAEVWRRRAEYSAKVLAQL